MTAPPPAPVRDPAWPLSRSAIGLWLTQGVISTVVWAGALTAFFLLVPADAGTPVTLVRWLGPVLVVVYGALVIGVRPRLRYRVHRWELTDDAVYTRAGWLTQEWRIAPVTRIQTVDSERGPIGRLFHLTKVTVTTASAAGPLVIDGLDELVAAGFASEVTAAAQASRGDAT